MERTHPILVYSDFSGIKIAAIAAKAGCSRMTLYRLMAGKQNATIDLLRRISAATGGAVSVSDLLNTNEVGAA